MKVTLFLSTLFLFFGFTNPPATEVDRPDEVAPYHYGEDFVASIFNCELEQRFETQFPEIVADVTQINAHRDADNVYYYAVYGINQDGEAVVDYFKTTEEEVLEERYNYIEMNENTMRSPFARAKCREKTTPPWNQYNWCTPENTGYICGVTNQWGQCIYY